MPAGSLIGFLGDVGVDCVAAMLACHKAGIGFVFLDARHPMPTLAQLAGHAGLHGLTGSVCHLDIAQDVALGVPRLSLDTDTPAGTSPDTWHALPDVGPQTLSHLRYTSGSTGLPKGVPISRANLFWALERLGPTIATQPDDRFGLFGHFWPLIIFEALRGGATLYAFQPAAIGAAALAHGMQQHAITVMATYSALWQTLLTVPSIRLPDLRLAHISGEPLSVPDRRTGKQLRLVRVSTHCSLPASTWCTDWPAKRACRTAF